MIAPKFVATSAMGCGRAAGVFPAVGVRKNLILCFAPAEDLIKDDRTERRGANTAHGKAAELKSLSGHFRPDYKVF
jgi:hypothetical protein